MKKVKSIILMMAVAAFTFTAYSCTSEKKGDDHDHTAMEMEASNDKAEHDMSSMQPSNVTFKDEKMKNAFQHYIHVRTALTNTDAKEAKMGADMLLKSLAAVTGNETALAAVTALASAEGIDAQRVAFSDLSEAMIVLTKGNLASGELYIARCPMALNGGANWISSSNEIANPYFGDRMMKCGSITETLN